MVAVDFRRQPVSSCSKCRAVFRKAFAHCPIDGAEVVARDSDPMIGGQLDHYTIERFLGEGAMGRVYKAHHRELVDRGYAIKILNGELITSPEARARFTREARNASRLSHPNIVGVIDAGESPDGLLYIVMELVIGTSLASLITASPMDPGHAADLIAGVCDGLAHAHARKVIHRDLKPENIMVETGPSGRVPRIADFGIAMTVDGEDARLTATGTAIGSPAYVAPEQASTGGREDQRADQYALGVTLFEMLTGGRLPFEGVPLEVVVAKTSREAPPIASLMPAGHAIPARMSRIVARMIARDPGARFATIEEVGHLLRHWDADPDTEVITAAPPRQARRVIIASALALVSCAAVVWAVTRHRWTSPEPVAAPSLATAEPSPATASPSSPVQRPVTTAAAAPEPNSRPPAAEAGEVHEQAAVATAAPPARTPSSKSRRRAASRQHALADTKVETRAVAVALGPVLPPPPVPAVPPVPPPTTFVPKLDGVNVTGALAPSDVRRAIDRVASRLVRCTSTRDEHARVSFSIGEARRPEGLRTSSKSSAVACVMNVLAAVRTENAADVGAATVVLDIAFKARP